jgi:hypothetical protein
MKFIRPALLVLTALTFAVACSKSSSNNNTSGGTLSATTGSTSFTAGSTVGFYSQGLGLIGVLGYTVKSSDTTLIQLEMAYIPPVNMSFSSDTVSELGLSYQVSGKEYDAYQGQGRVILSMTTADTVNHQIAGTFSGVVYNEVNSGDSLIISNGKFSSSYTVSP